MLHTPIKLMDSRIADFLQPSSPQAAGIDLRACWVEPEAGRHLYLNKDASIGTPEFILQPGKKVRIGSGIALGLCDTTYSEPNSTYVEPFCADPSMSIAAILLPRSGLGSNLDIRLANTVGLIDADYQGEVIMVVVNGGSEPFPIKPLDRLIQMVVIPVMVPKYNVVEEFKERTLRGAGGFGSTGKV